MLSAFLVLAKVVTLSQVGHVFFALAPLRSKRVLLLALRENQMNGVDLPESTCCKMLSPPLGWRLQMVLRDNQGWHY